MGKRATVLMMFLVSLTYATIYHQASNYWSAVDASIDGMMGGFGATEFGDLSDLDISTNIHFFNDFLENHANVSLNYACDCGAGIGRASKNFLLKFFEKVDLVDQNSKFLDEARDSYLKDEVASGKVQELIPIGLQEFNPAIGRYDMIWIQWVLVHLMDDDIIALLKRCRDALTTNGVIGVKENVSQRGVAETHDHSITRPPNELESIFEQAGLQVTKRIVITEPREYYPVHMYILK